VTSLNRVAFSATIHCLTGCSIGEVLGMILGTSLAWTNQQTIVASILLAFGFGYALTMRPLLGEGMEIFPAARLALASDTVSIAVMEVVDNAVMLVVPGAMDAPVLSGLFWISLVTSLILAGAVAFPVNRWLIARGRGHAVVHSHHGSMEVTPPNTPSLHRPAQHDHDAHRGH
jgi:hypothetical protein